MAPTVESSPISPEPLYTPRSHTPATIDVPGMMAGRIGDLYAEEERRRRIERTERMILKAESLREKLK